MSLRFYGDYSDSYEGKEETNVIIDKDRIKLAELIGVFDFAWNRDRCPKGWDDAQVYKLCIFDPETDANDDYAVLEYFRDEDGFYEALQDVMESDGRGCYAWEYKIGNYARAALETIT